MVIQAIEVLPEFGFFVLTTDGTLAPSLRSFQFGGGIGEEAWTSASYGGLR